MDRNDGRWWARAGQSGRTCTSVPGTSGTPLYVSLRGCLEKAGYPQQAVAHGVNGQPELLDGHGAHQRFSSLLTKDGNGGPDSVMQADTNGADGVGDLTTIGQDERPLLFRSNAELVKRVPGDPGIGGAGIHQRDDLAEPAPAEWPNLHWDSKVTHGHEGKPKVGEGGKQKDA